MIRMLFENVGMSRHVRDAGNSHPSIRQKKNRCFIGFTLAGLVGRWLAVEATLAGQPHGIPCWHPNVQTAPEVQIPESLE